MPLSPTDTDLDQATHVYVHLANHGGGWVLLVERDGHVVASEHCTDWHRVERRRKLLEGGMVWQPARVAAAILAFAAVLNAPPVFAQDPPSALLPEPRIVTRTVDFVTDFKRDEPAAKDGTGPFDRDLPDTIQEFAGEPGTQLSRQPGDLRDVTAAVPSVP